MAFQDSANQNQPDPSQPLTLNRPWNDPSVDSPYPKPPQPQYARAQMPPSIYQSQMNQPPRAPDQYGQDWWARQAATNYPGVPNDGVMPSGLESYPAMAKGNGYLAKWGSDNINQDAGRVSNLAMAFAPVLDLISRGAWSKEFNASSLNQLKLQQERLILEQERVQVKHAEELSDYGSILARADALIKAAGTDSGKAQRAIEDAREELRFVAETKYGHHPLVAMLDQTAGLDGVKDFLNREDAAFKETWAGLTSLKKVTNSERDAEVNREFGFGGGGSAGGITPGIMQPTPTPEDPEGRGPQTPQTGAASDYDRDLLRRSNTSVDELNMARQISMGQTPRPYAELEKIPARDRTPTESRRLAEVNSLQNQMTRDTEDAANTPNPNNDPAIAQRKLDRLRQINPLLYEEVTGQGTYQFDPTRLEKIGNRAHMESLVKRFFPNYDPTNYQTMKELKDQSSKPRQIMKATDQALAPIMQFWKAVNNLPQHDLVPIAALREAWAGHVTGSGQYRELALAAGQLARQVGAITTGSGVTRVSVFKQAMDQIQNTVSPEALREMLKMEASDIYEAGMGSYQDVWQQQFKRRDLVPGVTDSMWKGYSAIMRADATTGAMPSDVSNEWSAVGRKVQPNQALTTDQARTVDRRLTEINADPDYHNPNSPRYERLQHLYNEYSKTLPTTPHPPWLLNPDL